MSQRSNRGRQLRGLWGTLAAICLLGAAAAYGVTWYTQDELEHDATKAARKLTIDVLQPILIPSDAQAPIRGDRYDKLLAAVDRSVLAGPIKGIRLWSADGTILFADDPHLIGRREPGMRAELHSVTDGSSQGLVEGDRFRMLTPMKFERPPVIVTAELDRAHAPIVAKARERWYPWIRRGIVMAAVFLGLYVATAILFALLPVAKRAVSRRRERALEPKAVATRTGVRERSDGELPPYMQPGFQEEVTARRRAEEALEAVRQERDKLVREVRRLEGALEEAKSRSAEPELTGR